MSAPHKVVSRTRRIVLFGAFAYFLSLVDDNPVNADLLLGADNGTMEAILHILTVFFLFLAVREAMQDGSGPGRLGKVVIFATLAFLSGSVDDFTFLHLNIIVILRGDYWYPLDIAEHLVSLSFFYLAIGEARKRVHFI